MSDTWRDGLAVTGGIGVIITVLGFVFAMYQVSRATSVAEASSATAVKALNESRMKFKQYVVSHALKLISEARTYVKSEDWQSASMRLIDLTDMVAQVPDEDNEWELLASRLRGMEGSFERVRDGEINFSPSLKGKWRKLAQEISSKISESGAPFPIEEKEVKS